MAKPTDVDDWVEVVPLYETTATANLSIDASVSPPNHALTDLPDIPTSMTGRVTVADHSSGFPLTNIDGGPGSEAKFRTHINTAKILYDDPIRNFGQPGASHGHEFFGNLNVNAYSTYADLRNSPSSFAAGAELNGTAYWSPFPVKGRRAVRSKHTIIYYAANPTAGRKAARIPHGLRYVSGFDMDDPNKAWLQAHLDVANAAYGSARYVLKNGGVFSDQPTWHCSGATPNSAKWLKNADGSDPFNGTCASGAQFYVSMQAAPCWDGTNLHSDGGYKHVIPKVWDTRDGVWVCPKNFYVLPQLEIKREYSQLGPADYMSWRLTSDDMAAVVAARAIQNGESWHADWFDGWDQTTKNLWNTNCIGVEGGTPHECNDSVMSATQKLIVAEAAPNGRFPQVNLGLSYPTSSPANMWMTSDSHNGGPGVLLAIGAVAPVVNLFIEGDSISMCNGAGGGAVCSGSSTFTQKYAAANGAVVTQGYAVGGNQLSHMEARLATLIAAKPASGLWVVSLLAGANDLGGADTTAYLARLRSWATSMRSAGARVIIGTVLPNVVAGDGGTAFNADRAVINTGIRAMLAANEVDAVADFAADPIMGPDNSRATNPTYWSDATHPSGLGADVLKGIYQTQMDFITG